jgi:hypothetical protein
VTVPLFQWSVPLVAGAFCMLVAPLWIFMTPGADPASFVSSGQLGLSVVLYYPSAIAMLFIVSRLHRLVTRKAGRPRIDQFYLTAANIFLALAALVMIAALIGVARR